jgi:hypothetical protein
MKKAVHLFFSLIMGLMACFELSAWHLFITGKAREHYYKGKFMKNR